MIETLIVDLDGVVVNSYGKHLCRVGNKMFGTRVRDKHLTNYALPNCTPWTYDQLNELFSRPDYYEKAKPFPHAIESLNELYELGIRQHIITGRILGPEVRRATLRWLAKYNVPFNSFHMLSSDISSFADKDAQRKQRIAKALGATIAVEDSPYNARRFAEVCKTVYLVRNPLNEHEAMPDNVIRVNDLRDMKNYILGVDKP